MKKPATLFSLLSFLILPSCSSSAIDSIARENLFSLEIGPMEDQLALYGLEGNGGAQQADLAMRDGFFYVSDSNSGKIVCYNSYGDLIFMIYNEETNPNPVSLRTIMTEGAQATRWAHTYPLLSPGKLAVDSRRHIYAEERLPFERNSFDDENRVLLSSVILRFNQEGRFVEHIGQGGQGGSPFPHITGLHISADDELAVVCRLPTGWNVFWYSAQGDQLYLVQMRNSAIPAPEGWSYRSASIDSIIAAPDMRKLYIKVDYYNDIFDESENRRVSTAAASSLVWILDVESGVYEDYIQIPLFEYRFSEQGRTVTASLLYSMFALKQNGSMLLRVPVEEGYSLLQIDALGQRHRRGLIHVDPGELRYNSFHLSPDGILSALLVSDWNAQIVWWRLDQFFRSSR